MTQRVVYKVSQRDEVWAIDRSGEFVGAFVCRERAVKCAQLMARRSFESQGRPAVVRLRDQGELVDIILFGEDDPAANALAWIRRVSTLRADRKQRDEELRSRRAVPGSR